jgi:hypothetical protein
MSPNSNAGVVGQGETRRFYGKYRGVVVDNVDDEGLGRIIATAADVLGELPLNPALPALPVTSLESGVYAVPGIGASVWIEFEQGDSRFPIWSGGFWNNAAEVPAMAFLGPTTKMVLQTSLGNILMLDDEEGGISLQIADGSSLRINATGITLLTQTATLEVSDAGIQMICGASVLSVTEEGISINSEIVSVNDGALTVI